MKYVDFVLEYFMPTFLVVVVFLIVGLGVVLSISLFSKTSDRDVAKTVLEICLDAGKVSPSKCVEEYKAGVCK